MSTQFKCLFVVAVLAIVSCYDYKPLTVGKDKFPSIQSIDYNELLQPFMNQGTKNLFKAWHFISNKEYNYNSEEGLKRYKIFKTNYNAMIEHNLSGKSWMQGLNHLSDMTDAEIYEYYHLKTIDHETMLRNLRSIGNEIVSDKKVNAKTNVDHRPYMRPVRNQGSCGSCWAFTTQAVLEGSFGKWQSSLLDHFSTQHSVDCDTSNHGCNGGWYTGSFGFFKNNQIVNEADYPYTGKQGPCRTTKTFGYRIQDFSTYAKRGNDVSGLDQLLKRGPVAVAVDANNGWFRYSSGILDCDCVSGVNHAVTLVGYNCENSEDECKKGGCYYIIRNSWGVGWGEQGHVRIKDRGDDKSSCNVEKYGYAPTSFIK